MSIVNHSRYFIQGIDKASIDQPERVVYRTSTGSWTNDFHEAQLWSNLDLVQRKAAEIKKSMTPWMKDFTIGRVVVVPSGGDGVKV